LRRIEKLGLAGGLALWILLVWRAGPSLLIRVALGWTVAVGIALGIVCQLAPFLWAGLGFLVGIWQGHRE
jgi:hypothetical protein